MEVEKITVRDSKPETARLYLQSVWEYRSLILVFALRDLKIKYAQTFLGIFWVLLSLFPSVIIFTFFFDRIVKVDTGKLPYPVFALAGVIGWTYFTHLTNSVSVSLIEAQHLLKKIYFPKIILPLSKVLTGGVDFLISFAVVVVVMLLFGVRPGLHILAFPFVLLLNIVCGLALGLWVAALTYRYRDLQHLAPNVINFAIWLTPVFYPTTILPPKLNYIMYANPMALVVSGYRFALSGGLPPSPQYFVSIIPLLLIFTSGIYYFRKREDHAIEYI